MAVYTTAVPVLNQTKIKTNRETNANTKTNTNTKTKTLLRPLITKCICVYTSLATAATTPWVKDKAKKKVNAKASDVSREKACLQQKKSQRRQICKRDDPDDQQRQVAKFATKKEMANIAMANDRMSELPDGVYTRPTSTTVPPLSISSL